MNMSRIALLSAVFCSASIFASEGTPQVAAPSSMLSKVTDFVTTPFGWADSAASWVANKSYLTSVIGKITGVFKDSCIDKPELIGKSIVALATVYLTYKAYQSLNEQNVDNDDDMIFIDEEYQD